MALYLADWMTRIWTMQQALLSQVLVFLLGDCQMHGYELQRSMIVNASQPELHWQQWASIRSMHHARRSRHPMLDLMAECMYW
jgi:hypothetical protein